MTARANLALLLSVSLAFVVAHSANAASTRDETCRLADTWEVSEHWLPEDAFHAVAGAVASSSKAWFAAGRVSYGSSTELVVRRSMDAGASWETVDRHEIQQGTELKTPDMNIVVDPIDDTIYVAANSYFWNANPALIRRSKDGGATWTTIFDQPNLQLSYHPLSIANDGTLYFVAHVPDTSGLQIYTSSDQGATWTSTSPSGFGNCCNSFSPPATSMRVLSSGAAVIGAEFPDTVYFSDSIANGEWLRAKTINGSRNMIWDFLEDGSGSVYMLVGGRDGSSILKSGVANLSEWNAMNWIEDPTFYSATFGIDGMIYVGGRADFLKEVPEFGKIDPQTGVYQSLTFGGAEARNGSIHTVVRTRQEALAAAGYMVLNHKLTWTVMKLPCQ